MFFDNPSNCYFTEIESLNACFKSNFVILHFNIRSFTANCDEMFIFLSSLAKPPEVIILTETWFSPGYAHDIDGYRGYHVCRADRTGGGVSVYVSSSFNSDFDSDYSYIGEFVELCTVAVQVGGRRLKLVGIYRPPNNRSQMFIQHMREVCSNLLSEEVVLIGDINIDITSTSSLANDFVNDCYAASFLPLIMVPTRITDEAATCIDHIWYNRSSCVESGVIEVNITDHFPIFAAFSVDQEETYVSKTFRDHSESSLNRLEIEVSELCLGNVFFDNSIEYDDRVRIFSEELFRVYDNCCPLRIKKFSQKRDMKPWITRAMKKCIEYKHVLFRRFRSGEVEFERYNCYKNMLTGVLRRSKRHYYHAKFKSCGSDSKLTWKTINSVLNRTKAKSNVKNITIDGQDISDPGLIAGYFNEYFTGIASNLDNNIPASRVSPTAYMGDPTVPSLFLSPATADEVKRVIIALPNKSSSFDNVPTFVYKRLVQYISPLITHLFNESIEFGIFPDYLKVSHVTPVFKGGDDRNMSNYRPISNMPVLPKIFEKLMASRLSSFIAKNNLLNRNQFGFRRGCNTSDAVLQFLDTAYNSLNSKNVLMAAYLDFSKAFDTVNHRILLDKLHHYGVRGGANRWFESYLVDRLQCVSIDGSKSALSPITMGVPQGSILGPTLFLLYINDMSSSSELLHFVHFADDTTLYYSHCDVGRLEAQFNAELVFVNDWLTANRLSLNIEKTAYMLISDRRVGELDVRIAGRSIKKVERSKFLGVHIDDRLTFRYHREAISRKVSQAVGVLGKVSALLPQYIKLKIYFSLVYSKASYCVVAWGQGGTAPRMDRLILKARKYIEFPVRSNKCKLFNFRSIFRYFTAVKMFKIIKLNEHQYFSEYFNSFLPHHNHDTRFRSRSNYNIPFYVKSKCQNCFIYQSIDYWNVLPENIKQCSSLHNFKFMLRCKLLEDQNDS